MVGIIKRVLVYPKTIYNRIKNKRYRTRFGAIGSNTIVNTKSNIVPQNMYLDDYVVLQNNINFISHQGKLFVKKYSVISAGCTIIPASHTLKVGIPFYFSTICHIGDKNRDIVIEEDVWVGANVILLPGIKIGRGCVIGAGSVVTKDIPPYAVVVGVPAKIIACKFDKQAIIKHESIIYKEQECMSEHELDCIFNKYYTDLSAIGENSIDNKEITYIKQKIHR